MALIANVDAIRTVRMRQAWLWTTARGLALIVVAIYTVVFVSNNLLSAALAGAGLGNLFNPTALIIVVAGMIGVRSLWATALVGLLAGLAGRFVGISRLEPVNFAWEATAVAGTAFAAIILIGLADCIKAIAANTKRPAQAHEAASNVGTNSKV